MASDDLERAKNLLQGAVDAFFTMASHPARGQETQSRISQSSVQRQRPPPAPRLNTIDPGSSSSSSTSSSISAVEEHRRIFGYKPPKGSSRRRTKARKETRKGPRTWKKECICLRDREQGWKPTSEEKMQLATMGLGHAEVVFDCGGDAESIHKAILEKFPVLDICGGYSLLRLAENSHTLVEIVGPEGGMTVSYLKDILNQAKLYIRPLQKDIHEEDMESYSSSTMGKDNNEPLEICQTCNSVFPLSTLRVHVATCSEKNERKPIKRPSSVHTSSRSDWSGDEQCDHVIDETAQEPPSKLSNLDSSPLPPSPEPLSPQLEQSTYGSTTYSSFIDLISDDDNDWELDRSVQRVLYTGKCDEKSDQEDLTIEELLKVHVSDVLCPSTQRITVRRSHIFEDAATALRCSSFNETKQICINFLGESAIDEGGPKREFFMLLMGAIGNNSSILVGPPSRRILRHNTNAFQNELYLLVGKIIALSVLHGGPGPVFFAPVIIDYLFGGMAAVHPTVDDVPDEIARSKIEKLSNSTSEKEFQNLLGSEEYEFRFSCGVSKPEFRIPFTEKEEVVTALCLHYAIFASLAELEQLRRGLGILGFHGLMESHPSLLRKVFAPPSQKINSMYLQDLFVPVFSPKSSNQRRTEESIMMLWIRYLQHIESLGDQASPTLGDILVFLTGLDSVPPLGFGESIGTVEFTRENTVRLPTVSTCSLVLRFPLNFPQEFDSFKEKMDLAILGSQGFFGTV